MNIQRESMEFDIAIVGAGPAGLATAIHLADLSKQNGQEISICILEKGAYVGAHIISGAVLESTALTELINDWQTQGAPVSVKANASELYYLTKKNKFRLPQLPAIHGKDHYVISLCELTQWLGEQAEARGVNIFPGFPGSELIYNDDKTKIIGIQTIDMGLNKDGTPGNQFQPGIRILARQTVLAEGCRGSLSEQAIKHFNLRENCDMQTYALGIKELWKIDPAKHKQGAVVHTIGAPLKDVYGGGFIYHFKDNLISLGFVCGLDYEDPLFSPYDTFQSFKQHPMVKPLLEGGECISYGARALNEGGYQCIPRLDFPGGILVGCAAGFVNVLKIKGIHNAIRSGIIAAKHLLNFTDDRLTNYDTAIRESSIGRELYQARNVRPSFNISKWFGILYSGIEQFIFKGKIPFTFHYKKPDHEHLSSLDQPYQAPSFKKRLDSVYLTGTKHREDEPCHLQLKNKETPVSINLKKYNGPESRYCPAGVYEFTQKDGQQQLQINFANCIHCKTCDIKDPTQNIRWTVPEGGDGPNYQLM
jgi:electron-transferring-flavoprotein dehydrogenase